MLSILVMADVGKVFQNILQNIEDRDMFTETDCLNPCSHLP